MLLTHFYLRKISQDLQCLTTRFFLINMLLLAGCYYIYLSGIQLSVHLTGPDGPLLLRRGQCSMRVMMSK